MLNYLVWYVLEEFGDPLHNKFKQHHELTELMKKRAPSNRSGSILLPLRAILSNSYHRVLYKRETFGTRDKDKKELKDSDRKLEKLLFPKFIYLFLKMFNSFIN